MGPDDIRRLRGALSREHFARQVEVTGLTVYRWELPEGASEARRPRGRQLARLRQLAARAEGTEGSAATAPLPPAGVAQLVAPLQRLALRGADGALVRHLLVGTASALLPGCRVTLEPALPAGPPPRPREGAEAVELADGAGGRLRLEARGPLPREARALLEVVATVGALALETAALRQLPPPLPAAEAGLVAVSPAMRALQAALGRVAATRSTVLVTGESGTGKELVARALHALSPRARRPWVAFNCAAVPAALFEGQLFGYRRGAFTGAQADHPGVLRSAEGGTLFLDEVAELPLEAQPKLLRFLETGEVLPLGESRPVRVDVRVVAATHRELAERVRAGAFREDLLSRLQVVPLRLPPLRERPEDVAPLAHRLLAQLTPPGEPLPTLAPDALAHLLAHPWPGNVRELRNVLARALALHPPPRVLTPAELPLHG